MAIRCEYVIAFISMQLLASAFTTASGSKDEISFQKRELTGQNVKGANSDGDALQEIESGSALGYLFINYQEIEKPTGLSEENTEYNKPNISRSRSERLLSLHGKQGNEGYLKSNESSFEHRIKGTALDRARLLMKVDSFKNGDLEKTKISQTEKQASQQRKTGESRPQQHKPLAARVGERVPKRVEGNLEQTALKDNVNTEQVLSEFATTFGKVNIPNSSNMERSRTKSGRDGKIGNEGNFQIANEKLESDYEGERRIAEGYDVIDKGVMRNGASETRIERVDEGEIGLVGEMIGRMNALNGSGETKSGGERMIVVELKGIDEGMRQGLVRDATEKTGEIEIENERKHRSREQDGIGHRWKKVDIEGKQVFMKEKEINKIIKVGEKVGPNRKEIMTQNERKLKGQGIELEERRKYGASGYKQIETVREGESRVLVRQGANGMYEARKLGTTGIERMKEIEKKINKHSRKRDYTEEEKRHRLQRVKEGLHEVNAGERRIFLGVIGRRKKELEKKEGAIAKMMNNFNRLKGMVGDRGIAGVKEGERGILGVRGNVQGEIRERERVGSKGIERERQGELRIATNTGKLKERFKERVGVKNEKGTWRDKAILSGIKERMMASVKQWGKRRRIEEVEESQRMIMRKQQENEERMKRKVEKHEDEVELKSEKFVPKIESDRQEGWDKWSG